MWHEEIDGAIMRLRVLREMLFLDGNAEKEERCEELLQRAGIEQASSAISRGEKVPENKEEAALTFELVLIYARFGREKEAKTAFRSYVAAMEKRPFLVLLNEEMLALLADSGGFEGMHALLDRWAGLFEKAAEEEGTFAVENYAESTISDLFSLGREDMLEYYWQYLMHPDAIVDTLGTSLEEILYPGLYLTEIFDKSETAVYWIEKYLDSYESLKDKREKPTAKTAFILEYIGERFPHLLEKRGLELSNGLSGRQKDAEFSGRYSDELSAWEEAEAEFSLSRLLVLVELQRYHEAEELLPQLPWNYLLENPAKLALSLENRPATRVSCSEFARFLYSFLSALAAQGEKEDGKKKEEEKRSSREKARRLLERILGTWLEKLIPADTEVEPVLRGFYRFPELSDKTRKTLHTVLRHFEPER